jgi:hypothetical protein
VHVDKLGFGGLSLDNVEQKGGKMMMTESKRELIRTCKDCGKHIVNSDPDYCPKCNWNHGDVWVLNLNTWAWNKENREG